MAIWPSARLFPQSVLFRKNGEHSRTFYLPLYTPRKSEKKELKFSIINEILIEFFFQSNNMD